MKCIKYLLILTSLILLICNYGCIVYRDGNLPQISPLSYHKEKKSIRILFTCEYSSVGGVKQVDLAHAETWRLLTLEAYRVSGLFSYVDERPLAPTDLIAEVKMTNNESHNIGWLLLSSFTFTLIPYKGSNEIIIETTMKNSEGDILDKFEKSEKVNGVIFLNPFAGFFMENKISAEITNIVHDLNLVIINEAFTKGAL